MTKSRLSTLLAATLMAGGLIMGTPAQATPGLSFNGTDGLLFAVGTAVPDGGSFASVTTTVLQWREGATPYSYLRIIAPPSNTSVPIVSEGPWVNVAQIQHENNVIPGGVFNFTINMIDNFTLAGATFALTGTSSLPQATLGVSFTETPNLASNAECVAASPTGVNPLGSLCDDIFRVPNLDTVINSFLFTNGVENFELSFRILAAAATGSFFDDPNNIIYTAENFTSNLFVQAQITQVPEPGSLALLGIGLVGLLPIARRAKKADAKKA